MNHGNPGSCPNEITFLVRAEPGGGFSAKAEGYSIRTEAEFLGPLKSAVREAVRCHFGDGMGPETIRLRLIEDLVVPATSAPRNLSSVHPMRFGPSWLTYALTISFCSALLVSAVWAIRLGFMEHGDGPDRWFLLGLAMLFLAFGWLMVRLFLRPELRFEAKGIAQRRAFGDENFIPWGEVTTVRHSIDDAWLAIGDGGRQNIKISSWNTSARLRAMGDTLLQHCPPEVWALDPASYRWLEEQVHGQPGLMGRPLF